MNKVDEIQNEISKAIQNLKSYSGDRENFVNESMALSEAKNLLDNIRERHLGPQKERAEEILNYCSGVLNKTLNTDEWYPEIRDMKEQLKDLYEKLEDLETYIRRTIELSEKVRVKLMTLQKRLK